MAKSKKQVTFTKKQIILIELLAASIVIFGHDRNTAIETTNTISRKEVLFRHIAVCTLTVR
jgi:hypothetical protein